jgi:DNA (cytosine-5)-methyltransferase 1
MHELIVDNFAGGGGASTGIEMAIGRSVDIAINHDPAAIAMHRANHPNTLHLNENVWHVNIREATKGRPVALGWFSPDCTHHSKARGGKPREKHIRGLAWVAIRWAAIAKPRVIVLENVEEFQDWGPLTPEGFPDPKQKGRTFRSFVNALRRQGYDVEWRELRACDYGAPTIRKRFFLIARCDGRPIVWPEPTHGDPNSPAVQVGRLKPWRTAGEIIDWSIPCPSIFDTTEEIKAKHGIRTVRPLAENTLRRIGLGVWKFIINNPDPFIAPVEWKEGDHSGPVAAFLAKYHTETTNDPRGQTLDRPLLTQDTSNRFALVTARLQKAEKVNPNTERVYAFLIAYYGSSIGQSLDEPLATIVTKDRFGLVMVRGTPYKIVDIGLRMLEPHELYAGQGFPPGYIFDRDHEGRPIPKKEQVAKCGNAVPPQFAEAIIRANLPELCIPEGTDRFSWEAMLA